MHSHSSPSPAGARDDGASGRLAVLVVDDDPGAWACWHDLLTAAGLTFSLSVEPPGADLAAVVRGGGHDLLIADEKVGARLIDTHPDPPPRAIVLLTDEHAATPTAETATVHRFPKSAVRAQTIGPLIRAALAHVAALAARREAEYRLRSHFESLPNPAYVWRATPDNDFRLIDINDAAHALTRGRIRSRMGERATAFFSHRPDIVATMRRCLAERRPLRREGPYVMRTTEEERYLATTYAFVPPDVVVGHTEDRTDRRRAECEAVERGRQFQALFDSAKDAILIADDNARYADGNPAALALLGVTREHLLSVRVHDVAGVEPHEVDQTWRQFLQDGSQHGRMVLRRSDGALRTVDFSATANFTPGRHLSIMRDVTEREELERELQHAWRLDSIGRLAGGIAHDFNNLLTAIMGFADLLLVTFPADDARRTDVGEIHRAAESAAGLIRQLLAFSRKQVLQPVVLDVNGHIGGLTSLLRRLLGEAVEVRTRFRTQRLRVVADPTQLEQIILNLGINARDAMPGGGLLEITTERIVIAPGTAREGTALKPGAYARLVVSDTGHGMSADTMAHIFEPFFTTKQRANGTGLGLATVYGIVKQSGGYIWVSSEERVGTSFELLLPAATGVATRKRPRRSSTRQTLRGAILVVDDDRAVRTLAARTLMREGFTVVEATSGSQALELVGRTEVSVLLTDVVMPGMTGIELAASLRATHPDVRVLFMSGYAADAIAAYGDLPSSVEVLTKPFTPDLLLRFVLNALERDELPR